MDIDFRLIVLAVHGFVGSAFFGLGALFLLSGAYVQGGIRMGFGILAMAAGVYFYRDMDG